MTDLPDDLIAKLFAGAPPLRTIRRHRGLHQNELASRANITPSRVRQIEETKRFRDGEVERLAEALDVEPCMLTTVRGRFRGCDEAMAGLDEQDA